MPNFKYTANYDLVYPDQYGLVVPGRVVEADQAPDFRWEDTADKPTDPPPAPPFLPEELRHVGPPVEVQIALQELAAEQAADAAQPAPTPPKADQAPKPPAAPPSTPAAPAETPATPAAS